jgi:O-succinylhomoserine sulfhydrylase
MIYLETPSNPGLEIIDLEWAGQLSRKHGLVLCVDNCFATPVLQTPVAFGADLVIHSATKYMDGQGRVLGGLAVGRKDLVAQIRFFARHTGPAMSPFNAWVLSKSLETLELRMERHCKNALALATTLEHHPGLEWVKYPFLPGHPQYDLAKKQMKAGGGVLTLCVKGGRERALRFVDALNLILITPNLGDSRSIVTHPATTTHSKLSEEERLAAGIPQGLIRISAGLEHVSDIEADILQALENSKSPANTVEVTENAANSQSL